MIYCRPRKMYIVWTRKARRRGLGFKNFIATASLKQAKYWAKKLRLKHRQIDVWVRGQKPYVLENIWS